MGWPPGAVPFRVCQKLALKAAAARLRLVVLMEPAATGSWALLVAA